MAILHLPSSGHECIEVLSPAISAAVGVLNDALNQVNGKQAIEMSIYTSIKSACGKITLFSAAG